MHFATSKRQQVGQAYAHQLAKTSSLAMLSTINQDAMPIASANRATNHLADQLANHLPIPRVNHPAMHVASRLPNIKPSSSQSI
jgi:hypothetical protein